MEDQNNESVNDVAPEVDKIFVTIDTERLTGVIRNYPCIWDPLPTGKDCEQKRYAWNEVCSILYPSYETLNVGIQTRLLTKTKAKWWAVIKSYENIIKRRLKSLERSNKRHFKPTKYPELLSFLHTKKNAKENDIIVEYGKYLNKQAPDTTSNQSVSTERFAEIIRNYPCIWDPLPKDEERKRVAWEAVCLILYPSYHSLDVNRQNQINRKLRCKWVNIIASYELFITKKLKCSEAYTYAPTREPNYTEILSFLHTKQNAKQNDIIYLYGKFLNMKKTATESQKPPPSIDPTQDPTSMNDYEVDVNILIDHISKYRSAWDIQQDNQESQFIIGQAWSSIARLVYPNFASFSADLQQALLHKLKGIWHRITCNEEVYMKGILRGLKPDKTRYTDKLTFLYTKHCYNKDETFRLFTYTRSEEYTGNEMMSNIIEPEIRFIEFEDDVLALNASNEWEDEGMRSNPVIWNANPEEQSNLSFISVQGIKAQNEMEIGEETISFQRPIHPQTTSDVPDFVFVPLSLPANQGELNHTVECDRGDIDKTVVSSIMQDYKALTMKQKLKFKIHTLHFFVKAQEERDSV